MNTLNEDLKAPLDEVQRWWIRKPIVIIFTLFSIPVGALYGACKFTAELWKDCW